MRMIKVFDSKNYSCEWDTFKRDSVRAIIFHDDNVLMIKSSKFGEYKFPGGGINIGESHLDTLIRETREEAGRHIIPSSVKEYGKTLIIRKGTNADEIFEQESFYYLCDIDIKFKSIPSLDDGYETEYGYVPVFVSLDEAIEQNKKRLNISDIPWVERDLFVLCELQGNFKL